MSVCFVWIDELVWLLGATPTIYPYALDYARYIIFGAPVMILAYILNNLLRWQGKANLSVIGLGLNDLYMFVGVTFLSIGYQAMKAIATFLVTWYNYFSRRFFLEGARS